MWLIFFFGTDKWESIFPEIIKVKEDLRKRGHCCEWLSKVCDITQFGAVYIKNGKTFKVYASDCPYYQGHWLLGGFGATDCTAFDEPIPGIITDLHCSKDYTLCPAYRAKNTQIQEN